MTNEQDPLTMLPARYNDLVSADQIAAWTDKYFMKTAKIAAQAVSDDGGDGTEVTYALFNRQPLIFAPGYVLSWLDRVAKTAGFQIRADLRYDEGDRVDAGEPALFLTGPMHLMAPLETHMLQKMGPCYVAAYNAWKMARALPDVTFLAMDARHCAGMEMAEIMAYGAGVGSRAAQKDGARGFIGNATDATAHYFGNDQGYGTMPHMLIGYYESTAESALAYHKAFPDEPVTVLVDYYGREVSDSIESARALPDLARAGRLSVRIDTNGARYLEGLDRDKSYAVLDRFAPRSFRGQDLSDSELGHLLGTGVSAAAVWHLRDSLDRAGFESVKIVASSGFTPEKCRMMGAANAPIDVVGTGSYLPMEWTKTYTTADVIAYDGRYKVKEGRAYLIDRHQNGKSRKKLRLG